MITNECLTNPKGYNPSPSKDSSSEPILALWADSIYAPKGNEESFQNILEEIRTSDELRKKIEVIRAVPDKDSQRQLKESTLPWFSLAQFTDNHRSNINFESIQYLKLDIDNVADPDSLKRELSKDSTVMAAFISPSGTGLKVFYELDRPIKNIEAYRAVYRHYALDFERRYGVKLDSNEEKAAQPCFYSFDPNIYSSKSHVKLPVPETSSKAIGSQKSIPVIDAAIRGADAGERTQNVTRQVGFYLSKGFSEAQVLQHVREWNKKNNPPLPDEKIKSTVVDMYKRYAKIPQRFIESEGSYFKSVGSGKDRRSIQMSTFTIQPKELLTLPNSDCLKCDVTTNQGHKYENVCIENSDWHSKTKLLKAIGHQDCSFLGSEYDIQGLCSYVIIRVDIRKRGTKVIGLLEDYWITKECSLSASGIVDPAPIVPFDKGADAFYHKIDYLPLSDLEYENLAREFITTITEINSPEVILPWLGWLFASPLKPRIQSSLNAFPIVFVHGAQGSGKTSTALLLMKLLGYRDPKPNVVTMKSFPMLKLLSSTNAIPVFLDEYKVRDMKQEHVENIHRYMRKTYNGEVESKGRQDQTVEDYILSAPMVVMGEWDINEPAIKERVLVARFSSAVKKNPTMQAAYKKLINLPLEGFMPRYIQYALAQDFETLLKESALKVEAVFNGMSIAPRIMNNLSVMVAGLELLKGFAGSMGIPEPAISFDVILKAQLKEITGSEGGFTRSAVDQLIEELGFMWQKNDKQRTSTEYGGQYRTQQIPWWKKAKVNGRESIAILFNKVFPEFKEYAYRTSYEGELLDKASFLKLFAETDYVTGASIVVDFDGKKKRCLCVDIDKAKAAGIDLEGFEVEV